MRTAYEWEIKTNKEEQETIKERNIHRIKKEIKRIVTTTLKGNFSNPEDKEYWIKKLNKLNNELLAFEAM